MPIDLPVKPLPRLDVEPEGGLWRLGCRLVSPAARHRALRRLLLDARLPVDRKLARMRTLVDLGVWSPGMDQAARQKGARLLSACLFQALMGGNPPACDRVLHLAMEAGADPQWSERNSYNDNFLTFFARKAMVAHFKVALAAGADPYRQDSCGEATMAVLLKVMASTDQQANALKMADMLVAAGVDINHPGKTRPGYGELPPWLPLQCALVFSREVGLPWMLANGADPNTADHEGNALAHWICKLTDRVPSDIARLPGASAMDLHLANHNRQTPLWLAVASNNRPAAEELIAAGAALDAMPPHGSRARRMPNPTLLEVLIKRDDGDGWALGVASKILAAHPDCWSWKSSSGSPMDEWVKQEVDDPRWHALASQANLHDQVDKPVTPRQPRVLRF